MRKLKNEELERLTIRQFKLHPKTPFIIVLDNVRSLNNIGSIFRTCDAFLVEAVYLCGITATPPHKDIRKTALGASESVEWTYFQNTEDAIYRLKAGNYRIVSVEQTAGSKMLHEFTFEPYEKIALIFGNEVKGVQQSIVNLSDDCIEIPQFGTKHSFNISVSAGIVLWELFKKHKFEVNDTLS